MEMIASVCLFLTVMFEENALLEKYHDNIHIFWKKDATLFSTITLAILGQFL